MYYSSTNAAGWLIEFRGRWRKEWRLAPTSLCLLFLSNTTRGFLQICAQVSGILFTPGVTCAHCY